MTTIAPPEVRITWDEYRDALDAAHREGAEAMRRAIVERVQGSGWLNALLPGLPTEAFVVIAEKVPLPKREPGEGTP